MANVVVYDQAELIAALAAAPNNTAYEIGIGASFTVNSLISVPANKVITLVSEGPLQTMMRAAGYTGFLIIIAGTSALTLADIVIDGNKANVNALTGMINGQAGSKLTITAGTVLQNNGSDANISGGAISMAANGELLMTGGLITGNFLNAEYLAGGGGIACASNFTMTGGEISGNRGRDGGGVLMGGDASVSFHLVDGLITGNTAERAGGVYLSSRGTMVMDGGSISDNHLEPFYAGDSTAGGAVAVYNSTFTMNGGIIEGNTAGAGGGVHLNLASSRFVLNNGIITGNLASYGAGVYSGESAIEINGGVIIGNGNESTYQGGGIWGFVGGTTITNGLITGNKARYGGGMYASRFVTIISSTISGNSAGTYGGGIATATGTNLRIETSLVTGNVASSYGGGIYGGGGYLSGIAITDSQITANTAAYGGGIYDSNAPLTLSGAEMMIADNAATSADACNTGGGIFSVNLLQVTVNPGVIFTRNYAAHAFNLPLGTDLADYNSVVHEPSLDPQYDYAWNNADINWCPVSAPTMQITYHRNSAVGDTAQMTLDSILSEGDAIPMIPPPWINGTLYFVGWSLVPDDTCPKLSDPMPTTFHAADFSADDPPNLDVYAIWCVEPISHDVTFEAGGGTAVPAQSVRDGEQATWGISTRTGCLLEGWYTNEDLEVRFNFATPIYEDLTLYARWICPDTPEFDDIVTSLTPEQRAELEALLADLVELAELQALLAALEAGDKCYNIGVLTEYGYQLVEHDGTVYLHDQLVEQSYLAIIPLTIAEVEADITAVDADITKLEGEF